MATREVGFIMTEEYKAWIDDIKNRIRQSQIKASVRINYELLDLYWELGRDIVNKQQNAEWGRFIHRHDEQGFTENFSWNVGIFSAEFKKYSLLVSVLS